MWESKDSGGTAIPFSLRKASGKVTSSSYASAGELDQRCDFAAVAHKSALTRSLVEQLARRDSTLAPDDLIKTARATFLELQNCWQSREYWPMQARLMPDLFTQHLAQIKAMVNRHEINKIEKLTIQRLDLVHIRYTSRPEDRSFTVLISARAQDYYIDDREHLFLRGDTAPAAFQEFWVFQYHGEHWLLREIEQTAESSLLEEDNYVAGLDVQKDATAAGVPSPAAGAPASPGGKLQRMLADLQKSNPAWNAGLIRDRTRTIFTNMMMARERNDTSGFSSDLMTSDLVEQLRGEVRQRQLGEGSIQYRNFCVRKVELATIQPGDGAAPAEITLRISWHAQITQLKRGSVASQDQYVTPRVEFCTFVLEDGIWKLKQIQEDMSPAGDT